MRTANAWRPRPSMVALRPLLLHLHLHLLLLLARRCLGGYSYGAENLALPRLDSSVEVLSCTRKGCRAVTRGSVPDLCTEPETVLVFDDTACFMAATEHAGYRPFDLSKGSGGEIVFCKQLLNLLKITGYSYSVISSVEALEACVRAGQEVGVEHVLFQHGNLWRELTSGDRILSGHRVREPFNEDCLISLTLWPTDHPRNLWPGDLRYYVTSFPIDPMHNSYILMSKPPQCPTSKTFKQPRLPPYGVLFEKYRVMPWKVNMTDPFSHNASFWQALQQRVHLVVLDCNDALAAKLQWDPDYKDRVTCWKESPLSKVFSYHDLMMGALFFLGLGATPQTPTPVDLVYCRTPIIMPSYQQPFITKHAGRREYYEATSSESVLEAVDYILANCHVSFEHGDGVVTKSNTCFQEPASLEGVLGEKVVAENFRILMRSKEIKCHNQPKGIPQGQMSR